MTCTRCGRQVPAGQLACACFVQRSRIEMERLTARRFLTGEITLRANDAGHARRPQSGFTWCGEMKFVGTGRYQATRSVPCGDCMKEIGIAAQNELEEAS